MATRPKYNVTEGAIYTYYPPVVTEDRFQIVEDIEQPNSGFANRFVSGFKSGLKGAFVFFCVMFVIGLLLALAGH